MTFTLNVVGDQIAVELALALRAAPDPMRYKRRIKFVHATGGQMMDRNNALRLIDDVRRETRDTPAGLYWYERFREDR